MSNNNKNGFEIADRRAGVAIMNAGNKVVLVNILKNKRKVLAAKDADVLENLSPVVRNRVKELQNIQAQRDDLVAKFLEERAALEAKYQEMYKPFYIKRYEVVSGKVEVEGVMTKVDATVKGVPNFWLNVMKNHDILADEITKRDEGPLKFLSDIKWSKLDDLKGFRLDFLFDTNPFFKNSVLTKTYYMIDEHEPILDKSFGTEIEWYPGGKCVTHKILKKKLKKGSESTKPIINTKPCESFFNFFSPPLVRDEDKDIENDDAEALKDIMEQDYAVGATIRDEIIPNAVSWFTEEDDEDELFDLEDDDEDWKEDSDEDGENEKITGKEGGNGMAHAGEGNRA